MKGAIYTAILSLMCLVISCSKPSERAEEAEIEEKEVPQEQRELKALYDEVIDIHDEVMPKMDDLMKAKGALQERLDTLRDVNPEDAAIPELEKTIISLTEADEAMMNWMRNFKPQDDAEDHKAAMDYYQEERKKISSVKDQMLNALEEANQLRVKEE